MKTVKIEDEYYDKVKALSDASGRTVVGTVSAVLGAGLGELDDLGEAINNVQEHQGSVRRKIGNPVKAELEVQEEEEEEEEEEEQGTGTGLLWLGAALIGILALRHRMQQADSNAQQNGLIRNG